MNLMYALLEGAAITGSLYYIFIERKTRQEASEWAMSRLREEIGHNHELLSSLPKGDYLFLSTEEQSEIDEHEEIINSMRAEFENNTIDHLWGCVPRRQQRELRVKYNLVRLMLKKIPENPYSFNSP